MYNFYEQLNVICLVRTVSAAVWERYSNKIKTKHYKERNLGSSLHFRNTINLNIASGKSLRITGCAGKSYNNIAAKGQTYKGFQKPY